MKKLILIFLTLLFSINIVFSEKKISTSNLEKFIKSGTLIKIIHNDNKNSVDYIFKSNIAGISLSDDQFTFNRNTFYFTGIGENDKYYLDENSNIIIEIAKIQDGR